MSNVRFKLNLRGLNELMKSPEMHAIVNDAAGQLQAACGRGYEAETAHNLGFDAIASVYAGDYRARRDNRQNGTLDQAARSVHV